MDTPIDQWSERDWDAYLRDELGIPAMPRLTDLDTIHSTRTWRREIGRGRIRPLRSSRPSAPIVIMRREVARYLRAQYGESDAA